MKTDEKQIRHGVALLAVIILILAITGGYMAIDRYLVGDEVVTYGMANSTDKGWMLSTGRIRAYFEDEILTDSVAQTIQNIAAFGMDLAKNRRGAAYFSYPRPEECGWYGKEQISDWFSIREDERLHLGDVYLNAMGDDANSYLYYELVHLSGSLFPAISATKWSAFLVNAVALVAVLLLLYGIAGYFTADTKRQLLVCLLFGCSVGCLDLSTYLRAYMLAMAFQLALLLVHLKLYQAMRDGMEKAVRRDIAGLLVLYPLGYIAHYTTGVWAVVFGIATLVWLKKNLTGQERKKNTRRYLICGILAVGIGILLDPMSVLGLFSKLSGTGTSPAQAIKESAAGFVASVFGNVLWMAGFCILFVINLVRSVRKAEKKDNRLVWLEWLLAGYCALIVLTTRFPYFKVAYPLMFLVIVMELNFFAETTQRPHRIKMVYSILAVVFTCSSLVYTYYNKNTEVRVSDQVEAALEAADTDRLILIREHAEGYECFPLLGRYESVYVLTNGEEKLDALLADTLIGEQKDITILITNTKADARTFQRWVSGHGFEDDMDILCKTGKYEVIKWHRE
ncbi:hypothetical protein [Roseburia hominis]|uniref:hypothetical protein n=1 Tax=Roseburia hominis TaxID=301301 RepID=UPI0026591B81|nr:hypothetical protein [Roseburia hominis]